MKKKYAIVSMDVWGNPKDGWEVNNWYRHGAPTIELDTEWSFAQVIQALKQEGHLKKGVRASSIGIEGSFEDGLYLTDERRPPLKEDYGWGKPEYNLEPIS